MRFSFLIFDLAAFVAASFANLSRGDSHKNCYVHHICFSTDQNGSIGSVHPQIQSFTSQASKHISGASYSAVSFSDGFKIISTPTTVLHKFLSAINARITAGGATNMYAGLGQCYKYVE